MRVREEIADMPESAFVAQYRDNIPPPDRRTTVEASWRSTATGQAAAAAALATGRGRGRGRGRGKGRGRGRKGGPYWLWGEGEASSSQQEPEEYQNVEVNTTQNAPDAGSDEN